MGNITPSNKGSRREKLVERKRVHCVSIVGCVTKAKTINNAGSLQTALSRVPTSVLCSLHKSKDAGSGWDEKSLFFKKNLFGLFSLEHFVDRLMWQQWWNHQTRTEVEDRGFPDLEEKLLLIYWFCSHEEEGKNNTASNERTERISTKKPNQTKPKTRQTEIRQKVEAGYTCGTQRAKTDPHRHSQAGRQLPLGISAQKVRARGFCQGLGNLDGPYREWTNSCTWISGSDSLLRTLLSIFFLPFSLSFTLEHCCFCS